MRCNLRAIYVRHTHMPADDVWQERVKARIWWGVKPSASDPSPASNSGGVTSPVLSINDIVSSASYYHRLRSAKWCGRGCLFLGGRGSINRSGKPPQILSMSRARIRGKENQTDHLCMSSS